MDKTKLHELILSDLGKHLIQTNRGKEMDVVNMLRALAESPAPCCYLGKKYDSNGTCIGNDELSRPRIVVDKF